MKGKLHPQGELRLSLVGAVIVASVLCACSGDDKRRMQIQAIGGDPQRGSEALYRYGCGTCHTIPGVAGATGAVGPPLGDVGNRWYIAGMLPNTPANMMLWIKNPQVVNPKTAMPNVGVSDEEVLDMVTYFYTLPD